jgi:hypothetical protein
MIPTKTYPLSAIMGDEVDDYERGYAQGCDEGKERIAELEAQLKHCEGHAAELETEVRAAAEKEAYAVCAEICQEESTDNGTAQKIEARIRALKGGLE